MFNMKDAKPVGVPLGSHFKLRKVDLSENEMKEMEKVPYDFTVGSLLYAMACTRLDIAHAIDSVSRLLANPDKEHWQAVMWIMRYLRGTSKLGLCFR